jgi:hypothetical protein
MQFFVIGRFDGIRTSDAPCRIMLKLLHPSFWAARIIDYRVEPNFSDVFPPNNHGLIAATETGVNREISVNVVHGSIDINVPCESKSIGSVACGE